jgi:hypothetical protein
MKLTGHIVLEDGYDLIAFILRKLTATGFLRIQSVTACGLLRVSANVGHFYFAQGETFRLGGNMRGVNFAGASLVCPGMLLLVANEGFPCPFPT